MTGRIAKQQYFETTHGKLSFYLEKQPESDTLMVFLPGFSGNECYYGFKNLAQLLSKPAEKLYVDMLGRGRSQDTSAPRTNANITLELHELITAYHKEKLVLIAHSFSGVYVKAYLDRYPDTVAAVILFEPSTIIGEQLMIENPAYIEVTAYLSSLSYDELMVEFADPDWTDTEKESIARYARVLTEGSSFEDEAAHIAANAEAAAALIMPENVNVLLFCQPFRQQEYQSSEYKNGHTKVVTLTGNHYLHLRQKTAAANSINAFLMNK